MRGGLKKLMIKREEQSKSKKLTELDETTIEMSKHYIMFALIIVVLSAFSIFTLRGDNSDEATGAFVVSIVNAVTMSILLVVIFVRARRVWKSKARKENKSKS